MAAFAACVSTLIALVLGECTIRIAAPQDITGSFRVQSEERGQLINRAGGEAPHSFGERHVVYRFNSLHMRGGEPRGAQRNVLLLGDSFTFGVLLEEEDTYAAQLDAMARDKFGDDAVEVLNAGVPGFGLANYVAWVEELGDEAKPDLVVVFFNGGDIHRSVKSGLYTLDDKGELEAHDLPRKRLKDLANAIPGYRWLISHSHLLQLVRRALVPANPSREDSGPTSAPEPDTAVLLGEALFRRLDAWCDERGVPLVVLTTGFQDSAHFGDRRYPSLRFLERAQVLFDELDVTYVDLAPDLLERADSLASISIPIDEHPNERGAELIGQLAWPVIEAQLERVFEVRPHG